VKFILFLTRKVFLEQVFSLEKVLKYILITAEHVAKSLRYDVKVTVHGNGDIPITYDIKDLTGSEIEPSWFIHSEADVALLPLNPSDKFIGKIKVLDSNMLLINENEYG
jgi:hypothetical protein